MKLPGSIGPLFVILSATIWCATALSGRCDSLAELKHEAFDVDPGWEAYRNRSDATEFPMVRQDFGYSATHVVSSQSGEIGGRIQRASDPAYCASVIDRKTLDQPLSASGRFAISGCEGKSGVFIGWFNHDQPSGTARAINSFGLYIDGRPAGARLALFLITAQNQVTGKFITRYERYRSPEERAMMRPTPIRIEGTPYRWKLEYDPAGAKGRGEIRFIIDSESKERGEFEGKVVTIELPEGFREQGTSFDRFGLMNVTRPGSAMTVYCGDLEIDGRPQDLSQDPRWEGVRNRTSYQATEMGGAQSFGYSATSHAGGEKGEIGGIIWRAPYAYYADRVGPCSLDDPLEVSGRMLFEVGGVDAGVRIGWFNSKTKEVDDGSPDAGGNFIGVEIGGQTRIGHSFQPICVAANGMRSADKKGRLLLLKAGATYEWSCRYQPAANEGKGQIIVTLGQETVTLNFKPEVRSIGAKFDRFGLVSVGTGGGEVKVYLDDLKYSVKGRP